MMLSVDDYSARLLSLVEPLAPFPIGLLEARGCRLAEDVRVDSSLLNADHSTVDGYAVLLADVIGADFHEVALDVQAAESEAAEPASLVAGRAVRVFAGDSLPPGAEAVVPVEHTDGDLSRVVVRKSAAPGQFIRRAIALSAREAVVAEVGTLVDARLVGLLAAAGRNSVLAQPRPRLVVITVGDAAGSEADSHGFLLAAAAAEAGATAFRVGPVAESADSILQTLEDQLVRADLMVLTAVSAAGYEHIQSAIEQLDDPQILRVAMQPGVAHSYGLIGVERVPVIVLPGGAAATYISFEVLVRQLLRKMEGHPTQATTMQRALCDAALHVEPNKRNFIPAVSSSDGEGQLHVTPVAAFDIDLLAGLVKADCFISVPEAVIEVQAGDAVDILPIGAN